MLAVRIENGTASTRTASACALVAAWNAVSISLGFTRLGIEASPQAAAASSISFTTVAAELRLVEFPTTATRESLGMISFNSSSCFPLISGARLDNPVIFPPGRARLATNPEPTGSILTP